MDCDFQEGAPNPKCGAPAYYFANFFAENCMKIKDLDREWGCIPGAPLTRHCMQCSSFGASLVFVISSGSSDMVRGGARNMKSMRSPYICLSFCSQGGPTSVHAGIHPPPEQTNTPGEQADTPCEQTPPPGADTPQEQTPPGEQTSPLGADPPPGADTPLWEQTPQSRHP